MPSTKFRTVADVAAELGVSENEIRGLVSAGEIECTRIAGRIVFTSNQVEDARALLDDEGEDGDQEDSGHGEEE